MKRGMVVNIMVSDEIGATTYGLAADANSAMWTWQPFDSGKQFNFSDQPQE
jgi:hypothetical protein